MKDKLDFNNLSKMLKYFECRRVAEDNKTITIEFVKETLTTKHDALHVEGETDE